MTQQANLGGVGVSTCSNHANVCQDTEFGSLSVCSDASEGVQCSGSSTALVSTFDGSDFETSVSCSTEFATDFTSRELI